jgi:hypothetical protein
MKLSRRCWKQPQQRLLYALADMTAERTSAKTISSLGLDWGFEDPKLAKIWKRNSIVTLGRGFTYVYCLTGSVAFLTHRSR